MKHTNLSAFFAHAGQAPVYLVFCPNDSDRKAILEKLAAASFADQKRFETADLKVDILPKTQELSLFGGRRVFLAFDVQFEAEDLEHYLKSPSPNTHLLLGSKAFKNVHGAVCLDLSHEKPWEREKRLMGSLRDQALDAGKQISPDVLLKLIARVGAQWQLLEREVEKLISFVGPRKEISLGDLESISCEDKEQSIWHLSEEIIWSKFFVPNFAPMDTSSALALIGALRFQVQLGWQLCSSPQDAPPLHIKPYQAQKYGKLAHAKSIHFFEKALLGLHDTEKLLKSTSLDPRLILTTLLASLSN